MSRWEDIADITVDTSHLEADGEHIQIRALDEFDVDPETGDSLNSPRRLNVDGDTYGTYRLRISARGRDARPGKRVKEVCEYYLIQSWPAPPAPWEALRITSKTAKRLNALNEDEEEDWDARQLEDPDLDWDDVEDIDAAEDSDDDFDVEDLQGPHDIGPIEELRDGGKRQTYLVDGDLSTIDVTGGDVVKRHARIGKKAGGIIEYDEAEQLVIRTGVEAGPASITVEQLASEPGEPAPEWEDVGEVSITTKFQSDDDDDDEDEHVWVSGPDDDWDSLDGRILHLDGGRPGVYRLRVSGRGRDSLQGDWTDEVLEHYLVQCWRAPAAPWKTLRITSQTAKDWDDPDS